MECSCLVVHERGGAAGACRVERRELPALAEGEVRIRLEWSALNYKDALCATGHPGVALRLPLIPGIDAAGRVLESRDPARKAGDAVIVAAPEFGTSADGGFSTVVQVPGAWTIASPLEDLREAAAIGTAGFTALQCVEALADAGLAPGSGPVVVTGATGGVGIFAVMMLAQAGWDVTAVTGKPDRAEWLKELGARTVTGREAVRDESGRPLLSARWAGAVDTVGGLALGTILRSTQQGGCVAACGLAAGAELPVTVYPFILRGVRLQGIDSAHVSQERRQALWQRLAGPVRVAGLDRIVQETTLDRLVGVVREMLEGRTWGRTVVDLRCP